MVSILAAFQIILSKRLVKTVSPLALTWLILLFATPVIVFFAYQDGFPLLGNLFYFGILGSILFYTASKIFQYRAFQLEDLSKIYPIVAIGPLFTLIIAFLPPLNEAPEYLAVVGTLILLSGIYLLNVSKAKESLFKPFQLLFDNKASLLMFLSVIIDSAVIVFDKTAINNTIPKNTTFVLLIENIFIIFGLLPVLLYKAKSLKIQFQSGWKAIILLGVLNAASTIIGFSATGGGNVGIVSAIMKAQILFVLLFSFLFLKDRPKFETVIGSLIMILGAVLIKLGS